MRLAGALAIYHHHRGDLTEGARWIDWGLAHAPATPSPWHARALNGLSLTVWSQGDPARAQRLAETAQAMAETLPDPDQVALAVHLRGLAALAQGDLEQAHDLMQQTLRLQRDLRLPSDGSMALRTLSGIAYGIGDLTRCVQYAREALAIFQRLRHPSGMAGSLGILAQVAHEHGDLGTAVQTYQDALRLWTDTNDRWAAIAEAQGAVVGAPFPRWAGIDDRRLLFVALSSLAAIAADTGQFELAGHLLGTADRRRPVVHSPFSLVTMTSMQRTQQRSRHALGDASFDTCYAAGGSLRLPEAITLALGMTVTNNVSAAGTSSSSPTRPLTARQLEVLRLISEGRTDRDIAAALSIGHRTAQDHVVNLLNKLGVANRTEAAALAVRNGLI